MSFQPLTKVLIKRWSERGVNYVAVVLFLLLVVGGWWASIYIPGYYRYTQAQGILQDSYFSNRRGTDDEIRADVVRGFKKKLNKEIQEEDVLVTHGDRERFVDIRLKYTEKTTVPITGKVIVRDYEPRFEHELSERGSNKSLR